MQILKNSGGSWKVALYVLLSSWAVILVSYALNPRYWVNLAHALGYHSLLGWNKGSLLHTSLVGTIYLFILLALVFELWWWYSHEKHSPDQ